MTNKMLFAKNMSVFMRFSLLLWKYSATEAMDDWKTKTGDFTCTHYLRGCLTLVEIISGCWNQLRNNTDRELFAMVLKSAHSIGLEVHAWFLTERACLVLKRIGFLMMRSHTGAFAHLLSKMQSAIYLCGERGSKS